jgi:hypothetical protein
VDKPDLVADYDVMKCRWWSGMWSLGHYQMFFGLSLERPVSADEALEIIGKLNGLGPIRFEESWASVERNPEVFWRSQR